VRIAELVLAILSGSCGVVAAVRDYGLHRCMTPALWTAVGLVLCNVVWVLRLI
jgi:hypothetical protein